MKQVMPEISKNYLKETLRRDMNNNEWSALWQDRQEIGVI